MTSFRNTLGGGNREYVTPNGVSSEFAFSWDGQQLTGATQGWSCSSGAVRKIDAGGEPALQLDVSLSRPTVRVTKHYMIFPKVALIREWTDYKNTDDTSHQLGQPSFLHQAIMGDRLDDTDLHYLLGAYDYSLQTEPMSSDYSKIFDATGDPNAGNLGFGGTSLNYMPWFSLFDRATRDGVFMGFDYFGRWAVPVGAQGGSTASLSGTLPNYDAPVVAGQVVSAPKAFTGVYTTDLDNMTNQLLNWQYTYMWDYTRSPYFTAVRDEGPTYLTGGGDTAGLLQMAFGQFDVMREMGVDTYHRDHAWFRVVGDFEGPDWKLTNDYLAKSGMRQLVYYFAYNAETGSRVLAQHPDWFDITSSGCGRVNEEPQLIDLRIPAAKAWMEHLLISNAEKWGDYEWRNDNCSEGGWSGDRQLAQDQAFRQVLKDFLDARPKSGFDAVNYGGRQMSYDYLRYADGSSLTDGGGYPQQYNASRIFPVDKFSGVPEAWPVNDCDNRYNANLMWNPDLQGDTNDPAALECARKVIDLYHFITAEGVAGRWVQQYHPRATDEDDNWFERLSGDNRRGLVIYKGFGSDSPVTVYPKGLDPRRLYDVRFQFLPDVMRRTGADLMTHGITLSSVGAGELIWLNLPNHPAAATDHSMPNPPEQVTATTGTNMNYHGVDVNWTPGTDNNWISYYEVLRNGVHLATVGKGRYYFDHSPGASPTATYSVRTVDGDGNESAPASTAGGPSDTASVDDASADITYTGNWLHATAVSGAADRTQSQVSGLLCHTACQHFGSTQGEGGWSQQDGPAPPPAPCHLACQEFSGTQGENGWSYQSSDAGQWSDIATYHEPFFLWGECCAWYDFSDSGFSGLITPRYEIPGANHDVGRAWTAPKDGVVDISAQAIPVYDGNQAVLTITKNGQPIWGPTTLDGTAAATDTSVPDVAVSAGDVVRFEMQGTPETAIGDAVQWDPDIHYQGDPPVPPAVGPPPTWQDIKTYNSEGDFNQDGSFWHDNAGYASAHFLQPGDVTDVGRAWTAPHDGTIDIAGTVRGTRDGQGSITASITKNGEVIWGPQTLAANDTTGVEADVTGVPVAAGDLVRFVVAVGSAVTYWDPDLSYEGGPAPTAVAPSASWTFTGSQVSWYAQLGTTKGIVQVLIDGQPDTRLDLYAPSDTNYDVPMYTKSFPSVGTHTITVEGTGDTNVSSTGPYIDVDGFQAVTSAPSIAEDGDLSYSGSGWLSQADASASGGHMTTSGQAGDAVSYLFSGRSVTWVGSICPSCGEADVYVDGKFATRVDTYGYRGPDVSQAALFEYSWQTAGSHVLRVVVTGTRNLESSGTSVNIDSFQVS